MQVLQSKPQSLDRYIDQMDKLGVKVFPVLNKSNQLQGFRFEYNGANFKGSNVHRNMSGSKIIAAITQNNKGIFMASAKPVIEKIQLLNKTVQLSSGMTKKIARDIIKQVIKKAIDNGIGMGMGY